MKIAVITDVHSNAHSLNAVLADIDIEKPDLVVCAGDMVACSAYAGTREVWETLQRRGIACVIGNEEQRILRFHDPQGDTYLKESVQYLPLQYRARQFSARDIEIMRSLPVTLRLPSPRGQDVLVCHASPGSPFKSPFQGIDAAMEQDLAAVSENVIVSGHLHKPLHQTWREKLLLVAGSAGLPLRGELGVVDYLILTWHGSAWRFAYKTVAYDSAAALRAMQASDFLAQAGPIGWLMLAEALTQRDQLSPFLRDFCPAETPLEFEGWQRLVTAYLRQVGLWDGVRPYVEEYLR